MSNLQGKIFRDLICDLVFGCCACALVGGNWNNGASAGLWYWNCVSIKGRGLSHGKKYVEKILRKDKKNTKYCLKLDVKKFYPSISKEVHIPIY